MNEETRIKRLREYLFTIFTNATQINADMLGADINKVSLDRVPSPSEISKWIIGTTKHKDIYNVRFRFPYSQDAKNNLKNIGFFENFENTILENNRNGILPQIDGIERIECLNTGTLSNATTNTAEFDIQIQITYRKEV